MLHVGRVVADYLTLMMSGWRVVVEAKNRRSNFRLFKGPRLKLSCLKAWLNSNFIELDRNGCLAEKCESHCSYKSHDIGAKHRRDKGSTLSSNELPKGVQCSRIRGGVGTTWGFNSFYGYR